MPSNVAEISGMIALVSTALIGITILCFGIVWRGMTNTYFKLAPTERRQLTKMLWWTVAVIILVLFGMTIAGIYDPQLAPYAMILLILLIEVIAVIVSISIWLTKKIKGIKVIKKEQPPSKMIDTSSAYFLSFSLLGWSMFFQFFALLMISANMLDIQIGPYWLDNYNGGRWFMLDGMFLFIISLPVLGYACLKSNWQRELDSNQKEG